jgi:hypothetical protein
LLSGYGADAPNPRGPSGLTAQERLPVDGRQELLDAIYDRKPFRQALRDLGLTPNQVWGLSKTDETWSTELEAALRRPVGMTSSTAPTLHT